MGDDRNCKWCGNDISHLNSRARYCDMKCKGRKRTFEQSIEAGYFPKELLGPRPPVECPECGKVVEQSSGGKIYCEKDGPCSRRASRQRGLDRGYYDQPHVKERMKLAVRKHYHEGGGAEYAAWWNKSKNGKQLRRASRRKVAAKAALSAILLPVQEHPEVKS